MPADLDDEMCPPTERFVPADAPTRAAELVVAERFHAYRQIAAGAAYQLEAPIARLSADLRSVLESHVPNDARTDAALLSALRAAEQAMTTVRSLMAFASPPERPEPIDVHEAIAVAIRLARRDIDHRARLVRRYGAIPAVRISAPKLAQAILNLLHNAAEAIPRWSPLANAIVIATHADDGEVVIEIGDTGIGIEEDRLERVFDPFYTTRQDEDAPGLGLTAARALVVEAGGRLEIDSIFGRGTTCRIHLPAASETALPTPPHARTELPGRRVLAIASDADAGRALADLFEEDGTQVRIATQEEALESLSLGEAWDLVVFASADPASSDDLRARLAEIAPSILAHTFAIPSGRSEDFPSGVYRRTRQVQRVAG